MHPNFLGKSNFLANKDEFCELQDLWAYNICWLYLKTINESIPRSINNRVVGTDSKDSHF
jgi:hypothetical protein